MKKLKSLSVFFPAYNEQDNIFATIENAFRIIPAFAEQFEVIAINDGSKDNTASRLEELKRNYPNLKVVTHVNNKGYGGALKSGFANSRYEYIFYSDGDGQFDLQEMDKLLLLIAECDIAAGFRAQRQDKFYRILNAKAYNLLVRVLFGLKIKDIDCAFKLLKKKAVDSLDLKSDGAFISAELLIKAKKKGFIIRQCPVRHLPRIKGKATGNNLKVIVNSFKELFELWKELRRR